MMADNPIGKRRLSTFFWKLVTQWLNAGRCDIGYCRLPSSEGAISAYDYG